MTKKLQNLATENGNPVMVIGGGIAGIYCALNLAEMDHEVILLEKTPSLGGILPLLHRTYPDPCACCRIYGLMLDAQAHPNIQVTTLSQAIAVERSGEGFSVTVETKPRCVDLDLCIACGRCAHICPQEVTDGIDIRRAIFTPFPQAVPRGYAVDTQNCLFFRDQSCRKCEEICPVDAIDLSGEPARTTLPAGALVISGGIGPTSAAVLERYGHGLSNVFTALEFERLQNLSGPTGGRLVRPDTGKAPRKIAWIQCVGSRDTRQPGCLHCSSVCCMHAVKEAIGAKDQLGDDAVTDIFYMDLRAFGKGFDEYYVRAKDRGVGFKRSRVHEIVPSGPKPDDPATVVYYDEETGRVATAAYDMVVLSTGIQPPSGTKALLKQLGISTGVSGFLEMSSMDPVATSVPGVYICGSLTGPKDIYDSMVAAGAAAAEAALNMPSPEEKKKPAGREITGESSEASRIGLFLCRCPLCSDSSVPDQDELEDLKALPDVARVCSETTLCTRAGRNLVADRVKTDRLDQVLVTSCAATVHQTLLRGELRAKGLEPVAVHMIDLTMTGGNGGGRTSGGMKLPPIEVLKARLTNVSTTGFLGRTLPVVATAALVIGGTVDALVYASMLAEKGIDVHLVDPRKNLVDLSSGTVLTWGDEPVQTRLQALIDTVTQHPSIYLYQNAEVTSSRGRVGNFVSEITVADTGKTTVVRHGVTHLAPPTAELKPAEYLYGRHPGVITLGELEQRLADSESNIGKLKSIVFIQCVGSREKERPYCSRTCCSRTLSLALQLKESGPKTDITVFFRDMRTFGLKEALYDRARRNNIVFIRYAVDDKPVVEAADGHRLKTVVHDSLLEREIGVEADLVVLATAEIPQNRRLSALFAVDLDTNGFFAESHAKMKPVQFHRQGITMSGAAHGPKFLEESVSQAKAAAGRALALFRQGQIVLEDSVARVTVSNCPACCTCVRVCPYDVPRIEGHVSIIDPELCQGCGACVAACPGQYIILTENDNSSTCGRCAGSLPVQAATPPAKGDFSPDIVLFSCGNCPSRARDRLVSAEKQNPFAGLHKIDLPCLSNLDVEQVLRAFEAGHDGVLVAGCSSDESCLHKEGVSSARRKIEYTRQILKRIGLEEDRLHLLAGSAGMAAFFAGQIEAKTDLIRRLGPSPLKTAKGRKDAGR